jgi:condensin complex subunit 3
MDSLTRGNPAVEQLVKQEEDNDEDSTASRFTARLLKFLLKGFLAKDKVVRYRVLHLMAEMVSHLGEIEYVFVLFLICI